MRSLTETEMLRTDLLFLYKVLCCIELTGSPGESSVDFADQLSVDELLCRVQFLGDSLGLIPNSPPERLLVVANLWRKTLSDSQAATTERLRSIVREYFLGGTAERGNFNSLATTVRDSKVIERLAQLGFSHPTVQAKEAEAFQLVTQAIRSWLIELETNVTKWRYIPGIAEGDLLPLKEVYVDLYAVPEPALRDYRGESQYEQFQARKRSLLNNEVISIHKVLLQLGLRTVIIGEPGAGKTTIVKWVIASILDGDIPEYRLPIIINLGSVGNVLAKRIENGEQDLSVELFEPLRAMAAAEASSGFSSPLEFRTQLISYLRGRTDVVVILDGWDETPPLVRDILREAIDRDTAGIPTIITSRPSGLPKRYLARGASVYELVGMREEAAERLAVRYFDARNRNDLINQFLDHKDARFSGNPFLLTLRCALYELQEKQSNEKPKQATTRSQLYEASLKLLLSDKRAQLPKSTISDALTSLGNLAESKLFAQTGLPSYIFSGNELLDVMREEKAADAVCRSRIVQCIDSPGSIHFQSNLSFAFSHATFGEFLAARDINNNASHASLPHVGIDLVRLEVHRFLYEFDGPGAKSLRKHLDHRMSHPDRYGFIYIRMAQLLAGISVRPDTLVQTVSKELWRHLGEQKSTLDMLREIVMLLLSIAPEWFMQKCKEMPDHPLVEARKWIVMYCPSNYFREYLGHLVRLGGHWSHYAHLANRSYSDGELAAEKEFDEYYREFRDSPTALGAIQLGQMRNERAVQLLAEQFANPDSEVAEQAVYAVAAIKGPQASKVLVAGLLNPPPTLGASPFLNSLRWYGMKALDPEGKNKILRRIAVVAPMDAQVNDLLETISGHPVRAGAELIGSLVMSPSLRREEDESAQMLANERRVLAAQVLCKCEVPSLVSKLLTYAESEQDDNVRSRILAIAQNAGVPDGNQKWVLQQMADKSEFDTREAAVAAAIEQARREPNTQFAQEVKRYITERLENTSLKSDEPTIATAISGAEVAGDMALSPLGAFLEELTIFAKKTSPWPSHTSPNPQFTFACPCVCGAIASIGSDAASQLLRKHVELIERQEPTPREGFLYRALLSALVRISPEDVLRLARRDERDNPNDESVADTVLYEWSARMGCMVIGAEIIDANGRIIASVHEDATKVARQADIWKLAVTLTGPDLVQALKSRDEVVSLIRKRLICRIDLEDMAAAYSLELGLLNGRRSELSLQREWAVLEYLNRHLSKLRTALEAVNSRTNSNLESMFSQRRIADELGVPRKSIQNCAVLSALARALLAGAHAKKRKDRSGRNSEPDQDSNAISKYFQALGLWAKSDSDKIYELFCKVKDEDMTYADARQLIGKVFPEFERDYE
jgi:hypothetical protein